MKTKLFCRVFGHGWDIKPGFNLGDTILCARCGRDMGYMEQARRNYPEIFKRGYENP